MTNSVLIILTYCVVLFLLSIAVNVFFGTLSALVASLGLIYYCQSKEYKPDTKELSNKIKGLFS